jgi:hypothetical protein
MIGRYLFFQSCHNFSLFQLITQCDKITCIIRIDGKCNRITRLAPAFKLIYCLVYSTLKMEAIYSTETSIDFQVHSIISQKKLLFITTALRTSNPTLDKFMSVICCYSTGIPYFINTQFTDYHETKTC